MRFIAGEALRGVYGTTEITGEALPFLACSPIGFGRFYGRFSRRCLGFRMVLWV
jgi:hypothetical protein